MKSSSLPFWEYFKREHLAIEGEVLERNGSYRGLPKEALSTHPDDLINIFTSSEIEGTFVDLGCGTGETVLTYAHLFPDRKAIGVEFEEARLKAAKTFLPPNGELVHADLLTCKIPIGDTYFLYFPTGHVLDRILNELYESHREFNLIVIESHGDLIKRIQLENWLHEICEIPLQSPRHYPNAKVFRRGKEMRSDALEPFTLSFKEKFILVNDWIGETFGMEWTQDSRFELLIPPRTIEWGDVKKLMILDDFTSLERMILMLRREGELKFSLKDRTLSGFIRKIILKPTLAIEISNGEKVEWTEIFSIRKGSLLCYDSSQVF